MGFLATVTITFIIAKLMGLIDWSWWVVFSPVLVPVAIGLAVIIGSLLYGAIGSLLFGRKFKYRRVIERRNIRRFPF